MLLGLSVSRGAGSVSGTAARGPAQAVREWPASGDRILVFNDQLVPADLTEAQLRFAARHYAGAQKMVRSGARQLRQHNPGFLVLHYRLGQGLGHSRADADCHPTSEYIQIVRGEEWVQEWPGDSEVSEEWFYHWNGSRVFNCDWGHYLMDLENPAWRAWWSQRVMEELEANENDGVFADSYLVPNYGFTWKPALPVVDPAFEKDWARRQHAFTDYIRARFAGRWKWIPNIGGFTTTRDPSDYSNVDGVMIEQFAEAGHRGWFPLVDWELQMNRVLPLIRAGKILIAQSYPDGGDGEERLFILGSYLLVKGSYTYINLEVSAQPEWFPEYEVDLGAPAEALPPTIDRYLHPQWRVYLRRYAKGMVVVNPAEETRTIRLDRPSYRVLPRGGGPVPADGRPLGTLAYEQTREVALGPHTAAILLTARPKDPPGRARYAGGRG
jgi:hypothetical protein